MRNEWFSYVGLFPDREELLEKLKNIRRTPLEREYPVLHVTFAYHPREINEGLFGQKTLITAVGYGCDGRNEGLKVSVTSDDPELMKAYRAVRVPHITLSLSADGQAVDTGGLSFAPIEPFTVTGIYGGFIKVRNKIVLKVPSVE